MILSAQSIRRKMRDNIYPFCEREVFNGMSFGLSAAGYDIRIKDDVTLYPLWRFRFSLATSVEHMNFPDDIIGFLKDKSTWARRGLSIYNTVFEPGWAGYPTIELFNTGNNILRIKAGMPIGQMVFQMLDVPTCIPYNGKYQNQVNEPVEAIEENWF